MNARNATAGFSLVEVLCAVLILGVGLVGLTQGLTVALQSGKESELQTTAALLAAGRIEILRAEGFVVDGETDGEGEGTLSLYHWKQSVGRMRIEGLHEVTVVVENSKTGKAIYELRTLLFDPPVSLLPEESKGKNDPDKKREGRKR